jgi:ribonuclease VapC
LIVDTSALAAIAMAEPGWETLLAALATTHCVVPAPVLTELQLATVKRGPKVVAAANALIAQLIEAGTSIAPFEHRHTELTGVARHRFGKGNGRGGLLNFGDLLVYAISKDRGEALLCTGRDFASTDLEIHPASRVDR